MGTSLPCYIMPFVCATISSFGPGPYSPYGTVMGNSYTIMSSCRTIGLVHKTVLVLEFMFHCVRLVYMT